MFSVEPSPLDFLTALTPDARASGMELEVRAALKREMDEVLNAGGKSSRVWSTFFVYYSSQRRSTLEIFNFLSTHSRILDNGFRATQPQNS
jgi:hypothetical protein